MLNSGKKIRPLRDQKNIRTLVLSEKKFWTKQKTLTPSPLQVKWSVPYIYCVHTPCTLLIYVLDNCVVVVYTRTAMIHLRYVSWLNEYMIHGWMIICSTWNTHDSWLNGFDEIHRSRYIIVQMYYKHTCLLKKWQSKVKPVLRGHLCDKGKVVF